MDRELFSHLPDPSDTGDVSVGDAGDIRREGDKRPSQSEAGVAPTANVPVQNQQQNRRADENRYVLQTNKNIKYRFLKVNS